MARYRHHSGYLADDEAGHSTHMARVQLPKKPLLPEMGPTFKLRRVPHPPPMNRHQGYWQNSKRPPTFGSFLDFLTEGQVLDSLQSVVEKATERMATMKTEAGFPLVNIQDPLEEPHVRHRARARPSLSTVHRHRGQPTLCAGRPNNYPSRSSSVSDSHGSVIDGRLGSQSQHNDPGARGIGSLPPMKDRLLLEKNLKRLLRLENKGKGLNQSCSQRDSLGSQTSSQWTREQPLSWFSELLGSSSPTPEVSKLGPGEQELIFLRQELNKEIKSLLNQPGAFNLPGYSSLREPHCTLDFLAEHRLFPALQSVVSQAVDKLSRARRHNGCPLFPATSEPTQMLTVNSGLRPDSKTAVPIDREDRDEPCDSPNTVSNPKTSHKKSKGQQGEPQMATRLGLKSPTRLTKKKPLPSISSSLSYISNPWHEELTNFLVEQAVSLLICKYKFEGSLNKQLGFISFPITEALMDIFLGFKKVKGTHIRLSSDINWSCLLRKLEEAELARQAIKHISRPVASQHSSSRVVTSQHSTETPSVRLVPADDTNQDQATESYPSINSELPIYQLVSPWDVDTVQEQVTVSEPTLSLFPSISIDKSKETVNIEEEDNGSEEDEDRGSEEDEDKISSEDERTSPSFPEPELQALIDQSIIMGPGDPP